VLRKEIPTAFLKYFINEKENNPIKKAIGICCLLLVSFDVFLCSFFGTTTVKILQIKINQGLVKDSTKVVYNIFTDKDALTIKNTIKKFEIKNDNTLEIIIT
jgi:hypothetical protein